MAMNNKLRRGVVAGSAVAGIGLLGAGVYPALASEGGPDLDDITTEELLVKVAGSDTEQLSGAVRFDAGLNIPGLSRIAENFGGPAARVAELATGNSTLRVAVDGPERQRIEVGGGSDELSVIHNNGELWIYDGASNTAYHGAAPEGVEIDGERGFKGAEELGLTPRELAERVLAEAEGKADISIDGTAKVAGRDAYQVLVVPAAEVNGSVESVRIAVDAETGVPLAVNVQGDDRQLIDVAFTQIRYEKPSGGNFDFTPPQGADVYDLNEEGAFGGLGLGSGLFGLG